MKPALVSNTSSRLSGELRREEHGTLLVRGEDAPRGAFSTSMLFPAWQAQTSPEGDACSGYGVPALGACVGHTNSSGTLTDSPHLLATKQRMAATSGVGPAI